MDKTTGNQKAEDIIEEEIIAHRHDKFFRGALDNLPVAIDLIKTHAPVELTNSIDFNTLKPEKDSFIEKNLKKHVCDVLFSAKINGQDGYIFFLFEAQSQPDYWMSFRLMNYMVNICSRYLKNNPKATKLPLVYPITIYNGKQKYQVPRNLWELFVNPELAKKVWSEDHEVINVHEVPDEELLQRIWSGSLIYMLKHIFDKDIIKSWEKLKDVVKELAEAENVGLSYLELMLYYSLTAVEKNDRIKLEKVIESTLEEKGEKIMGSLAHHWYSEGRAEGMHDGIEKGIEKERSNVAIKMLEAGSDMAFISKVTGLSMPQIQKLKSKL
jgi:predicted transposase/invertase (TIGR01784 family)